MTTPESPDPLWGHDSGYVPVSPLLPEDPPRIGDFWLDARLHATPAGIAFTAHRGTDPSVAGQDTASQPALVILLSEGAAADPVARDRLAGVANAMHIDSVLARGGHGQDFGRLARKYVADQGDPTAPDDRIVAPWVALAYDGSPAAAEEAARILDEVELATLAPLGRPAGPGYQHYWIDKVKPGLTRLWPLPWPGRFDRAGWRTILVSWLLMILLAALAVLIAILIFRNQPPQSPPPPTGQSGNPPPQSSSPQSGSGSPESGSPSDSASPSQSGSPSPGPGSPTSGSPSPSGTESSGGEPTPDSSGSSGVPASSAGLIMTLSDSIPRLIATDLDGTFLSPDGSVSELNSAAVAAAQQAGIPVVFATGRPVRWLDVIRDLPGAHPTVIASNGAALYDLGAGELLDRICIDREAALEAVQLVRAAVPGVAFAFESGTRFGYEPAYASWPLDQGSDPAIFSGSAEQIVRDEDFVKMLIRHIEIRPDDLLDRVRSVLGDLLTATHSASHDVGLVEISAPGVSKASMLQRFCARLGIDASDVAAFGDMPNDVAMLSWAGMPYVVSNAHPLLLAGTFTVVPGNHESGVGQTIRTWLNR